MDDEFALELNINGDAAAAAHAVDHGQQHAAESTFLELPSSKVWRVKGIYELNGSTILVGLDGLFELLNAFVIGLLDEIPPDQLGGLFRWLLFWLLRLCLLLLQL